MITKAHFTRYIDFVFSSRKTLSINLGVVSAEQLNLIQRSSLINNDFRKAVPCASHAVIRSYVSKKETSPGFYNVTIVFDKR